MQQQDKEQCDNCLKMLPSSKIDTHFGYCRRNVKKCNGCGNMYDINFPEEHQEEFHKKESCNYCYQIFPSAQAKKHKASCSKKPQLCQYCQQNIPSSQYSSHVSHCESRTAVCQKCGKDVINKNYFVHITTCQGPQQVVENPYPKNYAQYIQNQRSKIDQKKSQMMNQASQKNKQTQRDKKQQKPMNNLICRANNKQTQKNEQIKNQCNLRKNEPLVTNETKEFIHSYSYNYSRKNSQAPLTNSYEQQFVYDPIQFESSHMNNYSNGYNYHNNSFNNDIYGQDPQLQRALMMSIQYENNLNSNFSQNKSGKN